MRHPRFGMEALRAKARLVMEDATNMPAVSTAPSHSCKSESNAGIGPGRIAKCCRHDTAVPFPKMLAASSGSVSGGRVFSQPSGEAAGEGTMSGFWNQVWRPQPNDPSNRSTSEVLGPNVPQDPNPAAELGMTDSAEPAPADPQRGIQDESALQNRGRARSMKRRPLRSGARNDSAAD
jgi:hypothetical protein